LFDDKFDWLKNKDGSFKRDRNGQRIPKIIEGKSHLTNPFTPHYLLNRYRLDFDSYIPFLVYVFYTKTHLLSPSQYNKSLSKHRLKLHNEIFKLHNQGLGYRRIHRKLVENGWEIGKSPNTVDSMIRKRLKRNEILNQPIIEKYQDFDIEFLQIEE